MPVIYHIGLTPPPPVDIDSFDICYYPVLKVVYESSNAPQDVSDILQLKPIVLMMSKNAVIGLDKWLTHFGLEPDYFTDIDFWTVGDRTHACLKTILGIQSFFPDEMTGTGVIKVLQNKIFKQFYF